jgi:hypothetical protein
MVWSTIESRVLAGISESERLFWSVGVNFVEEVVLITV